MKLDSFSNVPGIIKMKERWAGHVTGMWEINAYVILVEKSLGWWSS
jgi:hypothetical protein